MWFHGVNNDGIYNQASVCSEILIISAAVHFQLLCRFSMILHGKENMLN